MFSVYAFFNLFLFQNSSSSSSKFNTVLDSALHFSSSSLSLPDLSVNASHIQSNIPSRNDTINVDLRLNQPRSFRYNVNSPNHLNGSSQTVTLNQIKQPRSNVLLQNSICHQVSSSQYNSPQLASCPPQQPCSPNILPGPTNDVNSSLGSLSQSFCPTSALFMTLNNNQIWPIESFLDTSTRL